MTTERLGPSADKQRQDEQRRDERQLHELKLHHMRAVMATKEGQFVLHEILALTNVYGLSVDGSFEPNSMFFREGRREIGGNIVSWMLEADTQGYLRMHQELCQRAQIERLTKARRKGVKR